jgi:hypothetical protein
MKILFLAANPVDVVTRSRLDEEIYEIARRIGSGPLPDELELVPEWAVSASGLQGALLRHQPDIVHFSGHGTQTSGIILEDETGNSKLVSRKAIANLFNILKDNIRVVVLNAGYTKEQAQALAATIDFTIGMNIAIDDRAAIIFIAHFYQSLAFGRTVKEAFDLAVNALELEGLDAAHLPILFERKAATSSQSRIVAVSGDMEWATLNTKDNSYIKIGGQSMREIAVEKNAPNRELRLDSHLLKTLMKYLVVVFGGALSFGSLLGAFSNAITLPLMLNVIIIIAGGILGAYFMSLSLKKR